ncbi:uncharacterized protein METZ01_LOCUS205733, partial [marine metagenome]
MRTSYILVIYKLSSSFEWGTKQNYGDRTNSR